MPRTIEILAAIDRRADPRPADLGDLVAHLAALPTATVLRQTDHFVTFSLPEDGLETLRERFRGRFVLERNLTLTAPGPVIHMPQAGDDDGATEGGSSEDDPGEIREF